MVTAIDSETYQAQRTQLFLQKKEARRSEEVLSSNDIIDPLKLIEQDMVLFSWFIEKKECNTKEWDRRDIAITPEKLLKEYRIKSIPIRKRILNNAVLHRFESTCNPNKTLLSVDEKKEETRKLEKILKDVLLDMQQYRFAWFGIIFNEAQEIESAHSAVRTALDLMVIQLRNGRPLNASVKTWEWCKYTSDRLSLFCKSEAKKYLDTNEKNIWQDHMSRSMLTLYETKMLGWHYYFLNSQNTKAIEMFKKTCIDETNMFSEGIDYDTVGALTEIATCRSLISNHLKKDEKVRFDEMTTIAQNLSRDSLLVCISHGVQFLLSNNDAATVNESDNDNCNEEQSPIGVKRDSEEIIHYNYSKKRKNDKQQQQVAETTQFDNLMEMKKKMSFDIGVEQLQQYKAKHGHTKIVMNSNCPITRSIESWWKDNNRELTKDQIEELKALDIFPVVAIDICPTKKRFWQRLEDLKDFKKKFGHVFVPRRYNEDESFSNWVSSVKHAYYAKLYGKGSSKRKLTDEQMTALKDVFTLVEYPRTYTKPKPYTKPKTFWERLEDLKNFKKKFGHIDVPRKYDEDQSLSVWFRNMKHLYYLKINGGSSKNRNLTDEEMKALKEVGMDSVSRYTISYQLNNPWTMNHSHAYVSCDDK